MKVYYARPISLYDTKQDERDLVLLTKLFSEIVNPNTPEFQRRYEIEGMDVFVNAVKDCDVLAFRCFPGGKIPAGVMKEIIAANETDKIVIELPSITGERLLSVNDSREYLKLLGTR
jgi:hypothetical protein